MIPLSGLKQSPFVITPWGAIAPEDPSVTRLFEDGTTRLFEDGTTRVTEGS